MQHRWRAPADSRSMDITGLLAPGMMLGSPDNTWYPATILDFFGATEANRGIHNDDPTGRHLTCDANLHHSDHSEPDAFLATE